MHEQASAERSKHLAAMNKNESETARQIYTYRGEGIDRTALILSILHCLILSLIFFFNDTATTEIYTLSLHDALPILIAKLKQNSAEFYFFSEFFFSCRRNVGLLCMIFLPLHQLKRSKNYSNVKIYSIYY